MSFNTNICSPLEIHNLCMNLQSIGKVGNEHIVIKKDPKDLSKLVPTLAAKPKSVCARIYKPKLHRLNNAYEFFIDLLIKNETALADEKYVRENVKVLQKIEAYLKSKQLVRAKDLSALIQNLKPKCKIILNPIQTKIGAEKFIEFAKKEIQEIEDKFKEEEGKLNKTLQELVADYKVIQSNSVKPSNYSLSFIGNQVLSHLRNLDQYKDLKIVVKHKGQDIEFSVDRNLLGGIFKQRTSTYHEIFYDPVINLTQFGSKKRCEHLINFLYDAHEYLNEDPQLLMRMYHLLQFEPLLNEKVAKAIGSAISTTKTYEVDVIAKLHQLAEKGKRGAKIALILFYYENAERINESAKHNFFTKQFLKSIEELELEAYQDKKKYLLSQFQ